MRRLTGARRAPGAAGGQPIRGRPEPAPHVHTWTSGRSPSGGPPLVVDRVKLADQIPLTVEGRPFGTDPLNVGHRVDLRPPGLALVVCDPLPPVERLTHVRGPPGAVGAVAVGVPRPIDIHVAPGPRPGLAVRAGLDPLVMPDRGRSARRSGRRPAGARPAVP